MKIGILGLAAVAALLSTAALAQSNSDRKGAYDTSLSSPNASLAPMRDNVAYESSARDGCINQPGIPHNSADCSRVDPSDYNTMINEPSMAGDKISGATENAERNKRIISEILARQPK